MANTSELERYIYPFVLQQVNKDFELKLKKRRLIIGNPAKENKFDGVSDDEKIVLSIFTSSGYTKSGKFPSAKTHIVLAAAFEMNLTKAERKILAFTNEEFFNIIKDKLGYLLVGFELFYIKLPDELEEITKTVAKKASDEMA